MNQKLAGPHVADADPDIFQCLLFGLVPADTEYLLFTDCLDPA